jgi:hypothetical protein
VPSIIFNDMTKGELNRIVQDLASDTADFAAEDLGGDEAMVSDLAYVLMMTGRSLIEMGTRFCRDMPKEFQEDMVEWLKK